MSVSFCIWMRVSIAPHTHHHVELSVFSIWAILSTLDCACMFSCSVISRFFATHGLQPARLLSPRDSPGKNTRVACHALLQGVFLTQGSNPHPLRLSCTGRQVCYCGAPRDAPTRLQLYLDVVLLSLFILCDPNLFTLIQTIKTKKTINNEIHIGQQ